MKKRKPTLARRVRSKLGLSLEAFADRMGVHLATVYRWEAGQAPSPTAVRLMNALSREVGAQ